MFQVETMDNMVVLSTQHHYIAEYCAEQLSNRFKGTVYFVVRTELSDPYRSRALYMEGERYTGKEIEGALERIRDGEL